MHKRLRYREQIDLLSMGGDFVSPRAQIATQSLKYNYPVLIDIVKMKLMDEDSDVEITDVRIHDEPIVLNNDDWCNSLTQAVTITIAKRS